MQDGRVRAVFFDFGGVIARLDRELLTDFEVRHGLPEGSFLKALYTIPEWQAVEIGEGTEEEWVEIRDQFDELGYCCFTPEDVTKTVSKRERN